ncbi:small ribosomal subunit protein uS9m isoform X2 [Dermacentor andersoni]|uniref:small ribosomal subunit protein uS9m isoform X2 n=1 Tax=Dermacentor andersoni TaxID=34620 RepID=UPI00241646CD|nr:28S ribosomal protein S9, mitochondrial-like isoform X2 [Dermacentor andersoni]
MEAAMKSARTLQLISKLNGYCSIAHLSPPLTHVRYCATNAGENTTSNDSPDILQLHLRADSKVQKISKAMKAYLERAKAYDNFIKKEQYEFDLGKRHLANMMGVDADEMTQDDIDRAIQYLMPSGLHEPKARPIMKPPEDVFPREKAAQFDYSGRPFHYLFYTTRPHYYAVLHDAVTHLAELNRLETRMINRGVAEPAAEQKLNVQDSIWLPKKDLELLLLETLKDLQLQYDETGRPYAKANGARKHARAEVTVWGNGTGKVNIHGHGIEYFTDVTDREQIMFPLQFTGLLMKVDIEATLNDAEGPTVRANAIRHGLALALRSFLSEQEVEKMRLAGLLTRDPRRRERKKPGQEGSRRKYTWLKR